MIASKIQFYILIVGLTLISSFVDTFKLWCYRWWSKFTAHWTILTNPQLR